MARFKKGESGNPGGRPKVGPDWAEARDALQGHLVRFLRMSKAQFSKHMKGNPTMSENVAASFILKRPDEVIERFLGKVPQAVITDPDPSPVQINFVPFPGVKPIETRR